MRIFSCRDCEHKMRFGGEACGYCYTRKEWYQQPGVICSSVILILVIIILILASLI